MAKISANIRLTFIALVICCVMTGYATAHCSEVSEPRIINGSNYESTIAELDLIAQTVGEDKLIIMIARVGNREPAHSLNRRRLRTVRDYLKFTRAISEQRIVTAEGEPMRGLGRVEVYLDGKLFTVFTLERKRNFAPEP